MGISFTVTLCDYPDRQITSLLFEVTINPNCANGDFTGFSWDSNSLFTLATEERYLLDVAVADTYGMRSTTLFDESFGLSLQLSAPHEHCTVYYNLEWREDGNIAWETDLTIAGSYFVVTEPSQAIAFQDPIPLTPSACMVNPTDACGNLSPRRVTIHSTDIDNLKGKTLNYKLTATTYFPIADATNPHEIDFNIKWRSPCLDGTIEFIGNTDTVYTSVISGT